MNLADIKDKANTPGWGFDGDNGTNEIILQLISEIDALIALNREYRTVVTAYEKKYGAIE